VIFGPPLFAPSGEGIQRVQAFIILIGAGASPAAGGGGCAGFKWVRAEDVLDDKTILEMDPEGNAEKCGLGGLVMLAALRAGEKLITDREAAKEAQRLALAALQAPRENPAEKEMGFFQRLMSGRWP